MPAARTPSRAGRMPRIGVLRLRGAMLALGASLASAASGPGQTAPPGFAAPTVFAETVRAARVRAVHFVGDHGLAVAIGNLLELHPTAGTPRLLRALPPHDDVACLASDGRSRLWCLSLLGRALVLDLPSERSVASFAVPANAFDAEVLPGGDVLCSANPTWPAPGAATGVWLAGPARAPRELLRLQGPSGPLLLLRDGDLVVAELAPTARLLRIPAARVQQAIAGGVLTRSDVAAVGSGYTNVYDVAADDLDRLHVSDGSTVVVNTAPGALAPVGTTIDVGFARSALGLQFVDDASSPFRGFQPAHVAPALLVGHTDFAASFEVVRLQPERPSLVAPAAVAAGATAALAVRDGPPHGVAFVLATFAPTVAERVVAHVEGVPLWSALPAAPIVALPPVLLDAAGAGQGSLGNPGGIAMTIGLQAIALGAPGAAEVGSSRPCTLQLLP